MSPRRVFAAKRHTPRIATVNGVGSTQRLDKHLSGEHYLEDLILGKKTVESEACVPARSKHTEGNNTLLFLLAGRTRAGKVVGLLQFLLARVSVHVCRLQVGNSQFLACPHISL